MAGKRKRVLPRRWETPETFDRRLGDRAGRQRTMVADGHVLIILHRPPAPDELERTGRFFWRRPDGTWSSNELGSGIAALNQHLDEFSAIVEQLEEKEEKAASAEEFFDVLQGLGPLKRAARHMRDALQEAREALIDDHDVIVLRDRAEQIARTSELIYSDARNGLDYAIARRGEEQARTGHEMAATAHRLNGLAAFFLPLATLASVLGMNFKLGIEERFAPLPFVLVLVGGVLFGFVMRAVLERPQKVEAKTERRPRRRKRK